MTQSTSLDPAGTDGGELLRHRTDRGPRPAARSPGVDRPSRSGEPWTDEDYQRILVAVREGATDMADVAARIGRTLGPTTSKARRLLPLAERSAPPDRVCLLLREHQDDPQYDWRRTTLEEPPPRPVVQPPALTGIAGLPGADLVTIGYAVALAAGLIDEDVVARLGEELYRRGLAYQLVEHRTERLVQGAEICWEQARAEADAWVARTFADGRRTATDWYAEEYPIPAHW